LRGSETTEAISQCSENKEIATPACRNAALRRAGTLPSVARNDNPRITTQSQKGEGKERRVEFVSETNNHLVLQATSEEDSLLVLSDTYYPGWRAFVDGKKTKIYRADYTFRAIPISAGRHRVEFVYDPLSFKLGALFTILGIIGCVIYLLHKNVL
jgi:uncharacterized membrane protein YfhO